MSRAPRRLLDDPDVAAQLRDDLANARAQQVSFDPEQGLTALRGALDGVEATAAWGESVRAIGARWWGLAATGVATLGAVWWIQHASPVQSTPRAVPEPVHRAPPPEAPPAEPAPLPEQVPPVRRARAVTRKVERAAPPVEVTAQAATHDVPHEVAREEVAPTRVDEHALSVERADENELEHLARVRRLLVKDPREALAAARDGQARFARGLFVEERAGMVVFALERLGESGEALREGQRFLHAYPQGLFSARVRVIVAKLEGARE